ncbi:MAG TPA: alpha/beta hydrolase [Haliangiales bacterium]|nr:alpha/beta hydrolase [Haliangiales bacterium]
MTRALVVAVSLTWVGAGAASAQERELDLDVGDTTVHAHAFGPANAPETVLVVPGGPGLSHDYLLPLAVLAGPTRSVFFYDARGSGRSGSSPDLSLDAQVLDLDAVRKASGASRVHVLGHSWGTVIALAYTVSVPERVASLVLVGMGAPTAAADKKSFAAAFSARKAQLAKLGVVPRERPSSDGIDCMASFNATLPVHFADPLHDAARRLPGTFRCGLQGRAIAAAGAWDFRADLARLENPILFLTGDTDANLLGLAETARLARVGITVKLKTCGHFPFLECPETFFPAVERFLRAF